MPKVPSPIPKILRRRSAARWPPSSVANPRSWMSSPRRGEKTMTMLRTMGLLWLTAANMTQAPSESFQPVATMTQLMLDMIYPASNDILLSVNRGGPKDANEWAALRRSALALAESGTLLMMRGRARDQGDWMK